MNDWDAACMVAVAAVAVAAFCVTLDGYEAVYDDFDAVLANPNVRPQTPWRTLLRTDFWGADINGPRSNTQWRPLTTLSYRLDYALFCASSASSSIASDCGPNCTRILTARAPCLRGLHTVNVLLHAAVAALVYRAGTRVLRLHRAPACAAAVLFALHPVHIESVATLYGRADVLCALCMLAACLLAARAATHRSTATAVAALAAALASALAKEVGILVAPLVPAIMWLVGSTSTTTSTKGSTSSRSTKGRGPPVAITVLGVLVPVVFVGARRALVTAWAPPLGPVDNPLAFVPARSLARVLACAHLHAQYLAALVAPAACSPNYGHASLALVTAPADPRNLGTVAAYAAVVGTAALALRRRAWAVLLTVAWGVALFLPASNILFPVGTAFADRLLYLPSVPFVLLVGLALQHLAHALTAHCHNHNRRRTTNVAVVVFAALGAVVAGIAGVEYAALRARLPAWRNARALWDDVCRQFPQNRVALHNAAVEHLKVGDVAAALAYQQQLLRAHTADTWPPTRDPDDAQRVKGMVALLEFTQSLTVALAAAPPADVVGFANDVIRFFALPQSARAGGDGGAVHRARLGGTEVALNDVTARQALWTLLNTGVVPDADNEDLVINAVVYAAQEQEDTAHAVRTLYYQLVNAVLPRRLRSGASVAVPHKVLMAILPILDGRV